MVIQYSAPFKGSWHGLAVALPRGTINGILLFSRFYSAPGQVYSVLLHYNGVITVHRIVAPVAGNKLFKSTGAHKQRT